MSHNDSARAPRPDTSLVALGWLATGLVLALNDLGIAVATLGVGMVLWTRDTRIPAVALTQVGVGIVAPNAPLGAIAVLETGPTLLVLSLLVEEGRSIRAVLAWMGLLLVLSGTALAVFVWGESLLVATGVVLLGVATSSYAIHRYELVAIGLVNGEET